MRTKKVLLAMPIAASLVVALGLALLLAYSWLWAAVGDGDLRPNVYQQAMEDPATYDRYMSMVREQTLWMLLVFALGAWLAACGWYVLCWRTRIERVRQVQAMSKGWKVTGFLGTILPVLLAIVLSIWLGTGLPFMTSQLLTLVTLAQLLQTLIFALPFTILIYYVTTFTCTHPVYLEAIPKGKRRPWQT